MLKRVVGSMGIGMLAIATSGAPQFAGAEAVPHSLAASPEIYKVIAEGDQYRVIEVTWAAGQRDKSHSHPASAVYYPMDCYLSQVAPDGTVLGQRHIPAGIALVQPPIPSHSVQNVGTATCKVIMFEPK